MPLFQRDDAEENAPIFDAVGMFPGGPGGVAEDQLFSGMPVDAASFTDPANPPIASFQPMPAQQMPAQQIQQEKPLGWWGNFKANMTAAPGTQRAAVRDQAFANMDNVANNRPRSSSIMDAYRRTVSDKLSAQRKDPFYEFEQAKLRGHIPEDMTLMEYQQQKFKTGRTLPTDIQTWLYFNSLSPEDQARFIRMKRETKMVNLGGTVLDVNTGENIPKTVKPEDQPANIKAKAEAEEEAKEIAFLRANAQNLIDSADEAISIVDKALEHPGRKAGTGGTSIFNPLAIPGKDRSDFLILAGQLKGKAFLEAFDSLKGGGSITAIEGEKAEAAQYRLNEAQSESEYIAALEEMKLLIGSRRDKIRDKAKNAGISLTGEVDLTGI